MDRHDPPCADWITHIQVAVDALKPGEFPRLRDFVIEVEGTWDEERLAADPEFSLFLAGQPCLATAPCQGREGAGLERALPSTFPEVAA